MGDVRLLREVFGKERLESFKLTHHLRMNEAEIHLAGGGVDIALPTRLCRMDMVLIPYAAAPDVPMIVLTGLGCRRWPPKP